MVKPEREEILIYHHIPGKSEESRVSVSSRYQGAIR